MAVVLKVGWVHCVAVVLRIGRLYCVAVVNMCFLSPSCMFCVMSGDDVSLWNRIGT